MLLEIRVKKQPDERTGLNGVEGDELLDVAVEVLKSKDSSLIVFDNVIALY